MDKRTQLESLLIRDLRALAALSERKHFARTAEEFGVSQPTLSALVKRVEGIFGVTLFARSSRSFSVTPEGERVIRQVRAVLEELDRLAAVMDDPREALVGRFRLGVIPTLGPYYVPLFLGVLRREYPGLELVLTEAKTETLLEQLRAREVDAALLALPVEPPDLEARTLFREPFVLVVASGHPLASRAAVTPAELDPGELLILEQGNCLSDQTLSACGARRVEEVRPIHAASLETLRCMVASGTGIAVLPQLAVEERRGLAVQYVPFRPPAPSRLIGLVSRRGSVRGADVEALARLLTDGLPAGVEPAAGEPGA